MAAIITLLAQTKEMCDSVILSVMPLLTPRSPPPQEGLVPLRAGRPGFYEAARWWLLGPERARPNLQTAASCAVPAGFTVVYEGCS